MDDKVSKILIASAAILFTPLPLLVVGAAGLGGYLLYKGKVKVKPGYVASRRGKFKTTKTDKNRYYTLRAPRGVSDAQVEAAEVDHAKHTIRSGMFGNAGFIPTTVPKNELKKLTIGTKSPTRVGSNVAIDYYDSYNSKTGCAEVDVPPFTQEIKQKGGLTQFVRCDRVAVKLDKHGNIDWSMRENRNLLKNPQAVGSVLRRYPESFATMPPEVLGNTIPGTTTTLGDYFHGEIRKEMIDLKNGTSMHCGAAPYAQDGKKRSDNQFLTDVHTMMQRKINEYQSQGGLSRDPFKTSAAQWTTSAADADHYFSS